MFHGVIQKITVAQFFETRCIRNGTILENIAINSYAKFNHDRLQNEKVLGNWKSDNNKSKQEQQQLDYINSPAHCCITQPPAPSGESARVIA